MIIALTHAVLADDATGLRNIRVIGGDDSALSGCNVFGGVERKCAGTETADACPFVFGAVGLAGVFNHQQPAPVCDLHDRIHLARLAEDVHRHDGLGPGRDCFFYARRIKVECLWIDVDEYRLCAGVEDAVGRGDEAERRRDDLIACVDAIGQKRHMQRRRPRRRCDGVLDAADLGECFFQIRGPSALGQHARIQNVHHCIFFFFADQRP